MSTIGVNGMDVAESPGVQVILLAAGSPGQGGLVKFPYCRSADVRREVLGLLEPHDLVEALDDLVVGEPMFL